MKHFEKHLKISLFAVLFLAVLIPIFSFAQTIHIVPAPETTSIPNPLNGNARTLTELLNLILNNIVLPIGAIVIVFMIIYSGYLFVTARGSDEKIQTARRNFLYVIIGAAILLGAVVISNLVSGTVCQIVSGLPGCP